MCAPELSPDWIPLGASSLVQPRAAPVRRVLSTLALVCAACVTMLAGCSFVVIHPIVALALFFVGIPFCAAVLFVTGLLLAPQRK